MRSNSVTRQVYNKLDIFGTQCLKTIKKSHFITLGVFIYANAYFWIIFFEYENWRNWRKNPRKKYSRHFASKHVLISYSRIGKKNLKSRNLCQSYQISYLKFGLFFHEKAKKLIYLEEKLLSFISFRKKNRTALSLRKMDFNSCRS